MSNPVQTNTPHSRDKKTESSGGACGCRGAGSVMRIASKSLLAVVIFLLPLKFGSVLYTTTIGIFPESTMAWLLSPWPPSLLPVLAGLALASVAIAFPFPPCRNKYWLPAAPWLIVTVLLLPALFKTAELDRGLLFLWNLLSAGTLGVAAMIVLADEKTFGHWILAAVICGTLFASLEAWYEIPGGGLEEALEYAEQQAEQGGYELPPEYRSRLREKRASGPFVYPNSLAAHLILVLPLGLAAVWRFGSKLEPGRISRWVCSILFLLITAPALYWSGSRAALLALAGGLGIAFLAGRRSFKRKVLFIGIAGMLAVGGYLAVNKGRSPASAEARLQYWRAAVEIFGEYPLTGAGLGEFFPWYMRLLPEGAEKTRLTHNFFLLFAAEAGITGIIAGITLLSVPFWLQRVPRKQSGQCCVESDLLLKFTLRAGLFAWLLHSLADFNIHIPGTVAMTAVLIPLALMLKDDGSVADNGYAAGYAARHAETGSSGQILRKSSILLLAVLSLCGGWQLPGQYNYNKAIRLSDDPQVSLDSVREIAEKAAQQLPFSPYPYVTLSQRAEAQGAYTIAETALSKAVQRVPHRGGLWEKLAKLRLRLGMEEAAESAEQKAAVWQSD